MALSTQRRTTQPSGDDTWESIAAREFPALELEAATQQLQSWNMHVFMRPTPPAGSPRGENRLLPSDVIFLDPPQA